MKFSDLALKSILVLFPGMTGNNQDIYILNTITQAHDHDFICVVVNHWGAPGTTINTPKLYNGASSGDAWEALNYIWKRNPEQDLYAVGFSLGANLLTKYLGEEGDKAFIKGAVAIGNPWDLDMIRKETEKTMFGFYGNVMTDLWK